MYLSTGASLIAISASLSADPEPMCGPLCTQLTDAPQPLVPRPNSPDAFVVSDSDEDELFSPTPTLLVEDGGGESINVGAISPVQADSTIVTRPAARQQWQESDIGIIVRVEIGGRFVLPIGRENLRKMCHAAAICNLGCERSVLTKAFSQCFFGLLLTATSAALGSSLSRIVLPNIKPGNLRHRLGEDEENIGAFGDALWFITCPQGLATLGNLDFGQFCYMYKQALLMQNWSS
ncbi:hypothetical protein B0H10DRAFT_1957576 [Mycena sp. CBHHK59/15]|nr:hypothetical protein B0H10DRAFT_1957576 [Mycena sp. CBHHK59/15]